MACAAFAAQCAAKEGRDVFDHDDDAPGLSKLRRGSLGHEEAPLGGRSEGRVPVGLGHLCDALGNEALSGCVHEQVEAPELLGRVLDDDPGLLRRREVALGAPGRDHRPLRLPEPLGDDRTDTSGTACDEGPHCSGSVRIARFPPDKG